MQQGQDQGPAAPWPDPRKVFRKATPPPLPVGPDPPSDTSDTSDTSGTSYLPVGWIGVDEVGRGSLWGPVVVTAVYWPRHLLANYAGPGRARADAAYSLLQDSKSLTPRQRQAARQWLEHPAWRPRGLRWATVFKEAADIDAHGIRSATHRAMQEAIEQVWQQVAPAVDASAVMVVIDGSPVDAPASLAAAGIRVHCAARADAQWGCVAAASILAKETRDAWVRDYCQANPLVDEQYHLSAHVGYGTRQHQAGLLRFGVHDQHRRTFLTKLLGEAPQFIDC